MASKGSKIFQSLRLGIRKLIGGAQGETNVVEGTSKNVEQRINNGKATPEKTQYTAPKHDPFSAPVINPMSKFIERPMIEETNNKHREEVKNAPKQEPFVAINPMSKFIERPMIEETNFKHREEDKNVPKQETFVAINPMSKFIERPMIEETNFKHREEVKNEPKEEPFVAINPMSKFIERPMVEETNFKHREEVKNNAKDISVTVTKPTAAVTDQDKNVAPLNKNPDINIQIDKDYPERPRIIPLTQTKNDMDITASTSDANSTTLSKPGTLTNTKPDVGTTPKGEDIDESLKVPKVTMLKVEAQRKTPLIFEAMTPIRQVIKPHTPLIRFRKGSPYDNENLTSQSTRQTDKSHPLGDDTNKRESIMSSSAIEQGKWKSVPVIHEWWDTPLKYKRREIDDHECDIINGGGCDKIYQ